MHLIVISATVYTVAKWVISFFLALTVFFVFFFFHFHFLFYEIDDNGCVWDVISSPFLASILGCFTIYHDISTLAPGVGIGIGRKCSYTAIQQQTDWHYHCT